MIVKDLSVFLCLVCMLMLPTHGMMNFSTDKTLCVRPYIVNIELDDQILIMDDQKKQCEIQIAETFADKTDHCPIMWDKVLCWPEAKLNQSIYLPCPNYINKFNTRNKASKRCEYDPITSRAHWSKTNFHECLSYSPKDYCTLTSCSMENHLRYIIIMRVVGYVASMLTLVFSIIILMRPRLRCPRNYVHINLFVAFALRTILVMAVDQITRNSPFTLPKKNSSDSSGHPYHHHPNVPHHNDADYTFCRSITVIFRYSGSVYHTAILSEALYLVLLLKYPYYSELKGSKFCILISWVLPILWMIPWTLSRVFVDDNWCWQAESNTNLIIKIPHSILLILNIVCAVFIIRILYSKMRFRNLNRENIKRYRRLAKSILILIPIFGLHFTFFAWLPYASLVGIEISDCFELVVTYIEIFFNAFQGFVVSLTSCLIHHEVRIEFILFTVEIMKKVKCLSCMPCMDCLESDYIRNIRYIHLDPRAASSTYTASRLGQTTNGNGNGKVPTANGTRRTSALGGNSLLNMSQIDEERPMLSNLPAGAQVAIQPKNKKRRNRSESSDSVVHTPVNKRVLIASQSTFNFENPNIEEANSCCFCLFGNQKNDFFREHRLHSSSGGGARKSLPQSQNDAGGVEGADDVIEIGDNKRPSLFEKLMGKSKYPKGKKPPKTVTIAAVESSKLTSSNSLMADDNQVFEQNNTQTETRNTTNNNNISTIPSVNEIENEKPVQTVPVPVPVPITQDVNNTTPKFTLVMDDQNVPNNESDELQMNTEPTNIDSSIVQNTDNQEAMNVDENYTDKNIGDASLNGSINEPISNSNQNSLTDYETSLVHDSTNNNPINDEHEQEQVKVIEHDATILQPLNDQDTSRISFEAEEIMKMSDAEFDDLIVNYSNLNSLTDYEMSLEHVKPKSNEQPPKKHRSKSMSDLVRSVNNDNQNRLFPFKSYQTLCQSTNEQMQIPTNNNNTVIKYTDNLTGAGKNEPSEERINL